MLRCLAISMFALIITACEPSTTPDTPARPAASPSLPAISVDHWQQQASEQFAEGAARWQQALDSFDSHRDEEHLAAVREALADWYGIYTDQFLLLAARACQLEQQAIFRRLDSWPLYPGYLDALPQWPDSGLISDQYLDMTRKTLRIQHGATDSAEASLGFAALFVVLNGTGDAPKALSLLALDNDNNRRRRLYLRLAGEQLLADQQTLLADTPLDAHNLRCGLSMATTRHQQLTRHSKDNTEVIPVSVAEQMDAPLLDAIGRTPPAVINAWEKSQPGIRDQLAASAEAGWSALVTSAPP